ncbi:hypothetical protein [Aestuariibaculum marinum]|uniref:PD-(D/E)XK nuclease superfamily protein n=1 Tax=Aestuariibaculum marinum TaxID=2683592 RepID=A0A8J6Q195_9FLAO|nr:hypothetical protein [Aestuariibaculum marinum]MBD0824430.1 hypothetical protein [Aestuariibaculum marinum]
MNAHLNLFRSYSKKEREGFQLEDDLTRALAITLQENDVFSHSILKHILTHKAGVYENLFDCYNTDNPVVIDIQKRVESIQDFDHLFAVRISGDTMGDDFFTQTHNRDYNPITDLFIQIDNTAVIFEVKPGNHNSTAQLYNQALNAIKGIDGYTIEDNVTPVDLNWPLLMQLAVRVNNYQEAIAKPSRTLDNFIAYIKMHNYQWLPQLALSALAFGENEKSIVKRFKDAVENSGNQSISNRLGLKHSFGWGEELLIGLNNNPQEIVFRVFPGNTKAQGWPVFAQNGEAKFKNEVFVNGKFRPLTKNYHIKFSGQRYITGLWASASDFKTPLHTRENFLKHTGRKKREYWQDIEKLLDSVFAEEYNWKTKCEWDSKIMGSNRSQFDISLGYEISFTIPYSELQTLDTDKNNLEPLMRLIEEVKSEFESVVLVSVN